MEQIMETSLRVNDQPIELNAFVESFLARTALGAVSVLKGPDDIQSVVIQVQKGGAIIIEVNGEDIPMTPFPGEIIANTVTGLVSSLRGVDEIESMKASVRIM